MNFFSQLGIASLVLASSTVAASPVNGWYAGLIAGATSASTVRINIIEPLPLLPLLVPGSPFLPLLPIIIPAPPQARVTYKVTGNVGGQVGYRWCDNFRVEGQFLFNENKIEKLQWGTFAIRNHQDPLGFSLKGSTTFWSGFLNGFYDLYDPNAEAQLVPYAGVGIGFAGFNTTASLYLNKKFIGIKYKQRDSTAMGQGILGLSYFFDDATAIAVDVRYMTTRKIDRLNSRFSVAAVNVLLNYTFDQPMYNY